MSMNKNAEIFQTNTQTKNNNQFPIIKKIPTINKILRHSNSYLTPNPYENNLKKFTKNARIISYGPCGINIHTKFYRINDYLSRTNKDTFQTTNTYQRSKSINENMEIKKKNDLQLFKADTGLTCNNFFTKNKAESDTINSARIINNPLKLNKNKKHKYLRSESLGAFEGKLGNIINIDNNSNNDIVIKKLSNYNLKLLKNSRYFSNTKYISGPKNKNKHINKTCSTKNISFENTKSATNVKKTMNDIRVEKLLSKQKNLEETDKKILVDTIGKKTSEIGIETDNENQTPNPIFYDFIPIILQHLKRKEIQEETNKENEWIYNKINSIYDKSLNKKKRFTNLKSQGSQFLFENPIIRYLFLEKTLYNIKHTVKFIDIKNQEQLEQKVLKIIKEEYTKIKEKKYKFNINDFITYGYEFDPKLFIKFQQNVKKSDFQNYIQKLEKSVQKNISTKLSIFSNKGGFFATNKSELKILDKTNKSKEDISKEEKSSSEGILSRIFRNQGISNRIRKFDGLKLKDREKTIDSNKQNFSKLIRESEINFSIDKNKEEHNYKNLKKIDIRPKIEKEATVNQESEKDNSNADILPHPLFQNDKLREAQPNIQNSFFSTIKQKLIERDEKKLIIKPQKEPEKKQDIYKPSLLYFSKNASTISSNQSKENDTNKENKENKTKMRRYSTKRSKKKKKTANEKEQKSKEIKKPKNELDNVRTSAQLTTIEEVKNDSKRNEIKDYNEYEIYKQEMIEKNNKIRESKANIMNEIKKEEEKKSAILDPVSRINELKYSSKFKRMKTSNFEYGKKFRKLERDEFYRTGEKKIITQLKKLQEEEKDEKEIEEKEEENEIGEEEEDDNNNNFLDDYSDSIYSSEKNDMNDVEFSKEFDNKGDLMNKKWMENSPKFKSRIIDMSKRKRKAISASSFEMFEDISKNEKIEKLSDKMKSLYDKIKQRRKSRKKKIKKSNYYNFAGVDFNNIDEIEKKKKVYLCRLKEDIKYKISQGKHHLLEIENFKHFENAMNRFKLKDTSDPKKVKIYINLVERYLRFYHMELDRKEKEKIDEDRINRFVRDLNQEIYGTLPLVRDIKGRYCHSIDYFQELHKLSEIHGFLM